MLKEWAQDIPFIKNNNFIHNTTHDKSLYFVSNRNGNIITKVYMPIIINPSFDGKILFGKNGRDYKFNTETLTISNL